jgi:hypothetical protein
VARATRTHHTARPTREQTTALAHAQQHQRRQLRHRAQGRRLTCLPPTARRGWSSSNTRSDHKCGTAPRHADATATRLVMKRTTPRTPLAQHHSTSPGGTTERGGGGGGRSDDTRLTWWRRRTRLNLTPHSSQCCVSPLQLSGAGRATCRSVLFGGSVSQCHARHNELGCAE